MNSYGKKDSSAEVVQIPAVRILNGRGEFSVSMGVLPPWCRPFVRNLPWYAQGKRDVKSLAGIAIMAVAKRLASPTDRVDLLSKLQEGRDSEGKPMGREELTAEALTLLIAGSDTTSKYVFFSLSFLRVASLSHLVGSALPVRFCTTWEETNVFKTSSTKSWMNSWVRRTKWSRLKAKSNGYPTWTHASTKDFVFTRLLRSDCLAWFRKAE